MACNHPMKAFWNGSYTENGKKELIICPSTSGDYLNVAYAEKKGYRIGPNAPIVKIGDTVFLKDPIPIPCGSCVGCRMARAKQWKVRCCIEAEDYIDNCWFVTLTYRDDALPLDKDRRPYLKKSDFQKFILDLRGFGSKNKVRYFACGEYGSEELTGRPHFHAIIFGSVGNLLPYEFNHYHSDLIYKAWPFGWHDIIPANPNTIAYVAGYIEKKQICIEKDKHPVKPFLMMSTRPMIGYKALDKISYPDVNVYGDFGDVHNCTAPKAYLKKLEAEEWYEKYKSEVMELSKKSAYVNACVFGSSDPDIQGFRKDRKCNMSLENKRKETL